MYFCEKCATLNEDKICKNCGNKFLKPIEKDDYCFLTEKELIYAEMLKELLDNYHIPYICEPIMGVGLALKVGIMRESYQFFVPYQYYEECLKIVNGRFKE